MNSAAIFLSDLTMLIFFDTQYDFVESGILFILENFKSYACTVGEALSTGDYAKAKNGLDE